MGGGRGGKQRGAQAQRSELAEAVAAGGDNQQPDADGGTDEAVKVPDILVHGLIVAGSTPPRLSAASIKHCRGAA
ncbi:hypothetical protein DR_1054 [Deinococcus radiodurans R1 = ATCC 13939 = DSM 20539]|uniref:Uncharacterized protein n=1 Tax=Deinococcus radiodurans (strain ATCC 13939 / DSM 20539 / JCM 16871 / CCUG 27074 / LMG 4051 / NBRC 15346 / NCIMB 9279 / VKM B-1422 / R1) TaxID=243230 RepID=Q9RVH5_DEIRA|nr:hypothetical protein DR_1054 [Deinococcus radiodurans R1 = ATCC 13939 = DSM 20539]